MYLIHSYVKASCGLNIKLSGDRERMHLGIVRFEILGKGKIMKK